MTLIQLQTAQNTSPINISTTKTLKFMAVDDAGNQSQVSTVNYDIYGMEPYSYEVTVPYS